MSFRIILATMLIVGLLPAVARPQITGAKTITQLPSEFTQQAVRDLPASKKPEVAEPKIHIQKFDIREQDFRQFRVAPFRCESLRGIPKTACV